MKAKLIKIIKNNYKLIIIYVVLISLAIIKLDYQIYSPGSLINLEEKIEIENHYKSKGTLNLTYVSAREGTLLFLLCSYFIPSWDIIPISEIRIENETEVEETERNKAFLNDVNENALIVAFDKLNMEYTLNEKGVTILHVYESSDTNLKTGDLIVGINNLKIKNTEEFIEIVNSLEIGQKLNFKVIRKNKEIDCYGYLKDNDGQKIIGISVSNAKEVTTNEKVKFKFKNNEMGPSGGLMTALKIYDMLTEEDITKGKIISGTGTIDAKGNVGEISGIKYKLAGAVEGKSDVFISPLGNYEEVIKEKEKNNYKIKIISAKTFEEVLYKLSIL